ncbi:MAG: lipooligosaccharide transport system permease protein [Verrucomicrobiales bacterium]|jgi:lipooligosaccharide transport system permease protein
MSVALSGFLTPVLTMLALGWGIGSQIDDVSSLGTEDYLHFVGPGVMAGTAMLQGGFSSLWPALGALRWDGMYKNVVRSPASFADAMTGRLVWIACQVSLSSVAFLVVLLVTIGWSGFGALLTPLVAGLTGVAFAAPVLAFSSRRENEQGFSIVARLTLTPLFVFSGTFTTVDSLPSAITAMVKVFPGYHGIEITRDLINERAAVGASVGHLAVLALWIAAGWALSLGGFRKALTA